MKGEPAESCRNERRAGSLAAADEEIASARIGWAKIDSIPRLSCPTQTDPPESSPVEARNLTFVLERGQGRRSGIGRWVVEKSVVMFHVEHL